MTRLDAPATGRNRGPILAILERWLGCAAGSVSAGSPSAGASSTGAGPSDSASTPPLDVLEIASGTGQHAVFFAEALPHLRWQPSDPDSDHLLSIEAWRVETGLGNVAAPIRLDVRAGDWGLVGSVDAIFNANMIHIAPWPVAEGLFAGAARVLKPQGLLFLYGPFRVGSRHTAPSNEAFDADLRRRNPEWGIRDLEQVVAEASASGLRLVETDEMPANNKLLVFRYEGIASRA